MTEQEFAFLRELLLKRSGLSLSIDKRYLVESRLGSVCRQTGLKSISQIIQAARVGDEAMTVTIVEAMTTNETLFFRDNTPFKHLRELILPTLLKSRSAERTLRIWCAAASSGQEPYSIAMILDDMAAQLAGWRIEIIATDISNEIIEKARLGVYSQFEVQRGLPVQMLLKHFTQDGDRWCLNERIRRMVTYRQHNLVGQTPAPGTFDVILCRNILIYFDTATKSQVFNLLARSIRNDGYLILGAAETIMGLTDAFSPDRENRGIYRTSGFLAGQPAGSASMLNRPYPLTPTSQSERPAQQQPQPVRPFVPLAPFTPFRPGQ
ncbi:MAG: CheR family methyltransferase [Bosea sp. (in: a-proteobacteria)]